MVVCLHLLWALVPKSGLSEVTGMVSDTMFKKTVNESSMVTPEKKDKTYSIQL